MKKLTLAFATLALLSTGAMAGYSESKSTNSGGDKLVTVRECFPATGNWVNAATYSCPDQGSGGWGMTRTTEVKCDHTKR